MWLVRCDKRTGACAPVHAGAPDRPFGNINRNALGTRCPIPETPTTRRSRRSSKWPNISSAGCKPRDQFRIGTEHEKFGFRHADLTAPPYFPADGQPGSIRDLLAGLGRFGGAPILDGDNTIGLKQGAASVSLEPAGQLELSGGPLETLHETRQEFDTHFEQVRAACDGLDMGFAPLGFHPMATRAAMPWMPKGPLRHHAPLYAAGRQHGPGHDDPHLHRAGQSRFCLRTDMRRKLRVSLAAAAAGDRAVRQLPVHRGQAQRLPVLSRACLDRHRQSALRHSRRSCSRTGSASNAMPRGWSRRCRCISFIAMAATSTSPAQSFADYMAGQVPALAGVTPTMGDFADHVTTAFTDVRLKRFLEMRGADAGRADMMVAQSALWVGLLYDDAALTAAEALLRGAGWEDAIAARAAVPRQGLDAPWRGGGLRDIVADVVAIAADGLRARARRNAAGDDEQGYLDPLHAIAAGAPDPGRTLAAQYPRSPGKARSAAFSAKPRSERLATSALAKPATPRGRKTSIAIQTSCRERGTLHNPAPRA